MPIDQLHQGDYGSTLKFTIKDNTVVVDIDSFTTKEIIFTRPDGTKFTRNATLIHGGSGRMDYTIASGDLDAKGTWQLQGRLANTTKNFYTDIIDFKVHDNL